MDPEEEEYTIAYRFTEEPQTGSLETPSILRRLNGDRPRKRLPRLVGVVLGLSCTVFGETEDELLINAKKKIQSLLSIRRSRGLPIQSGGAKVAVQPPASSGWKTAEITVSKPAEGS